MRGRVSSFERAFTPSRSAVLLLLIFCGFPDLAKAQGGGGVDSTGTNGVHSIQGRIYFPSGRRADVRIKIRLESLGAGNLSVLSDSNGSFSFRGLEPGSYTVIVDGTDEYDEYRESVYIDNNGARLSSTMVLPQLPRSYTVQISLRPKIRSEGLARPEVVNAVLASVPKPAADYYKKARNRALRGDSKGAIENYEMALSLYPNFALALTELGIQYFKAREINKAIDRLKVAVKLSPDDELALQSLGIALIEIRKFQDAEAHLRRLAGKSSAQPSAHLYLGVALAGQRKLDDAQSELELALKSGDKSMGQAHYYLGGVLWSKQQYENAADHLEAYLKLFPDASNSEKVRATIKDLRSMNKN